MIDFIRLFIRRNTEKYMRLTTLKIVTRIEKKDLTLTANNNGNGLSLPQLDEKAAVVATF